MADSAQAAPAVLRFGPRARPLQEAPEHMMASPERMLQIVRGPGGLEQIASEWKAVIAQVADPRFFHLHEWYTAYLSALEPDPEAVLFCVSYSNGQPDGVFPLRQTTRRFHGLAIRTLELPRHPHMHLCDFIVPADNRTPQFLLWVLEQLRAGSGIDWDLMCLRNTLEDSAANKMCRGISWGKAFGSITNSCKYLPLGNSYDDLQGRYSKKFRATLRTARNRLKRLENVSFEVATSREALAISYQRFIDVEASGWKGAGGTGTAIKLDQRLTDFYQRMIQSPSEDFRCEIFSLCNNDHTLAAAFCIVTADTSYMLKIGYDEDSASVSPAQMLVDRVTRAYIDAGRVHTLNFVSGVDWVDPWTKARYPVHTWYLFNNTLLGLGARMGASCNRAARRLVRQFRPAAGRA
jgi:CelD/BcsL family acetyltransferase involved in cellulose biosynthesis